ncbi:MAG: hypothetical protein U9P10_04125, partial [Thermodesulfobacteriota bacterium]|nr:hypothetical protein [Thermodesulfobacteriota bacterium]
PADAIYDIVNQIADVASVNVIDSGDKFQISFDLQFESDFLFPIFMYLRWKLPNGQMLYVKQWDGTTGFQEWGLNLVSDPETFVPQFNLSGDLFADFAIYGDLFSKVDKEELKNLGGSGNYRFEVIFIIPGLGSRAEYTIPVYLKI